MPRLRFGAFGLLALAVLFVGQAQAQDEPVDDGQVVYGLELSPKPDFPNGNAVYLQAEADGKGQRYSLTGTELNQPILVSVLTQDPADNVRVRIVKDDWDAPDRDVTTAGEKRTDLGFRTFDGFKLWVTADAPTDYQLIVWVGAPMDIPPPPLAEPASTFVEPESAKVAASGGGVSFSYLELVLAGILALVVLGFVAFLLTRRKASNGVSP
jgi:hypothetical protein